MLKRVFSRRHTHGLLLKAGMSRPVQFLSAAEFAVGGDILRLAGVELL